MSIVTTNVRLYVEQELPLGWALREPDSSPIFLGSMGAYSCIVRGKGHPDSFEICSHGVGRVMSRTEAKRHFTLAAQRDLVAVVHTLKQVVCVKG